LLGQDSHLDVATLGVSGKEGERLVLVQAAAVHKDADGSTDAGARMEGFTPALRMQLL